MKKKTKLFATLTAICTSICLMVIGVIAASQVNLNVTSSVSFQSNGAYVKVKGEVQKGNADTEPVRAVEPEGSDYYYIGYSYDAVDKEQETDTQVSDYNDTPVGTPSVSPMTSWTIGNVEFSENESIIRYNLTFTNYSEKPVQATITTNKDAFLSDPEIQGKVNINETSKSVIIDGYDGTTPKTATYSITLTLTNFSTSFTNKGLTIDVNFSTEIMEPEPEELVPGLTVTISDEDKKEATIVDYAGNATNIVIPESFNFAEKEMPNSIIFESEDNTPPMAFKAMLCFGDLNIIFGDGTKIEGVNFLEMEGSMIEATYPITFEQTYTLKIENNELDMQLLAQIPMLVTEMAAGLGVTVELPKVKENGIAEWREFQDVEEFSTYVSSIMEAPGIANFPLEFEFEPPKHMLAVEGNDYTVTSIGDNAFYNCSSLTSVTISSSVTSIGNSAFSSCSSLATVTFGDNSALESIGTYAFYNCSSLTSIEIPESITSIEAAAFSGCSGLTSVTIPSSVTSIGSSVFSGCSGLSSITFGENSKLASIGGRAFYNCSSLAIVTFGDNSALESIGERVFWGCSNLTSITIPSSVTIIGRYAFYNCSSLATVTFGDNSALESIGEMAFYGCNRLTSVTIPSSVTSIGTSAFSGCSSLATVTFGDNSTLESIGTSAFSGCSSLATVTFGDNSTLESIGTSAFSGCSSLTSVTIPSSVKSIERSAFSGCSTLQIIVEEGNANYSSDNGSLYNKAQTTLIRGAGGVSIVEILDTVTSIGSYAFYGCSSLATVTFGDNSALESIGDSVFSGCNRLTSVTIPSSVTSIGSSAFDGCSSLATVTFGDNSALESIGTSAFSGCSSLATVTFGDNSALESIGNYAFSGCSSLTSIEIPEGVTSIGYSAFNGCSTLQITVEEGNANYSSDNGSLYNKDKTEFIRVAGGVSIVEILDTVTSIGYSAFDGCSSLATVTFGDNSALESIGDYAFRDCNRLTSITIPSSVTSIGDYAFDGCSSLVTVTFGDNSALESIGNYAFSGCNRLTSVTIPSGVTSIGSSAFYGCSSLTSIEIPENVTRIGDYAFSGCSKLLTITILSTTPPALSSTAIPSNIEHIYVPAESVGAYKTADVWNEFADKISAIV